MTPEERRKVRAMLIDRRDWHNLTNPRRTHFYLNYWRVQPEIHWALLAHLVSRNAGYQMSDLVRFRKFALVAGSLPQPLPATIDLHEGIIEEFNGLFMFLEVGNFLIFRDVYPQLLVYSAARAKPADAEQLFALLRDPAFDVDPFIIAEWEAFFAIVTQRAPTALEAQRLVFALIVNEQNQIEDRLIQDHGKYLGSLGRTVNRMVDLAEKWEATKLCFPESDATDPSIADKVLLYTVSGFRSLDARINTGKDLFVGLFAEATPNGQVLNWAQAQDRHKGTRVDYNPTHYSMDPQTSISGGKKYSPPLVSEPYLELGLVLPDKWRFHKAMWYDPPPMKSPLFRHIYRPPLPLRLDGSGPPLPVERRPEFTTTWLNPPANPTPLTSVNPGDLKEVLL